MHENIGANPPINPRENLAEAIAQRGLRPDATPDEVVAYDQAVVNARIERMGGSLMMHRSQLPVGYNDYAAIAAERGLEEGAGWEEIVKSYRQPPDYKENSEV